MFGIARVIKIKRGAVAGIERHNRRLGKSSSSPDVDSSRTHLNQTWSVQPISSDSPLCYGKHIQEKISALKLRKKPRSDAVLLLELVLTASPEFFKDLPPEREAAFFKQCGRAAIEFFDARENTIYIHLHRDEHTPHLHLGLVPIVGGRLCAKELTTRQKLLDFQQHMHTNAFADFGLTRGKAASETYRRHRATLVHKIEQLERKLADVERRLAVAEKKEQDLAAREQAIKDREQALITQEATLSERQQAADALARNIEGTETALLRMDEELGAKLARTRATMRACERLQKYADHLLAETAESLEVEIIDAAQPS